MLSSVLKIEKLLKCDLCTSTLRQARVLRDCGHRFCLDCLSAYIKEKNACPTCELPASLDDLTKDVMHDNLVAYISKLKRALLSHTLTPLEESLKRREEEQAQQEEIVDMEELSTSKKRVLSNTDTQDSEDLEEEYTDLNSKRFKPSTSTENLGDDEDDVEGRPRRTRHRNVPPPSYINLDDEDEDMEIVATILAAPPALVGAPVQENIDLPTEIPESSTTSLRTPDATETSDKKWECTECHYQKNQSYMQICGVCKKSKNRKIQTPISTRTRTRSISNHNNNEESASTSTTTTISSKSGPSLESATMVPQHRTRHMDAVINKEVHIIQTSLSEEDLQLMEKSSEKVAETPLKVTMYTELKYFDDVTHVISSVDNKKQCHRTLKYLHGLLLGKWIVSPQWYVDSIKAKAWLREEDYEILGDARAGLTHAPKKGRLEFSDEHRLFTDMNFHLIGEFTDKHNKKDIGTLIQVGGGKFNSRKPAAKAAGKPTKKLDPTRPIIICSHPAKYPWIKEFQSRDPSWVVDCISKLKVE